MKYFRYIPGPQNTQYQDLILYTNNYVYKQQNLAPEEQHRGIRFERKSDCISMNKQAGTCHRWCIWGTDFGIMRTSMGRFRDMLLGVSITFAKCISYKPNIDNMHNDNILNGRQ